MIGLAEAIGDDGEIVTLILGADAPEGAADSLPDLIEAAHPRRRGRGGHGRDSRTTLTSRASNDERAYADGPVIVSIRIVTDSTADLSPELAAEHNITVVPVSVLFGDEELLDGVDIQSQGFFERLGRESVLPTTSQPAPGAFRAAYEQLAAEGATEILSIHVSAKLSGTIGSARQGGARRGGAYASSTSTPSS